MISAVAATQLSIDDEDFRADFDEGRWVVSWKWADGGHEPPLTNLLPQYTVKFSAEQEFKEEVEDWIRKKWLVPWEGQRTGVWPLMAVIQPHQ